MAKESEYLDILTEEGEKTGETKPKDDVHRDGDWHKSVHVWVLNSRGELLIQRRAAQKKSHPNQWDISAAGHVSAGDSPIDAAIREFHAELGILLSEKEINYLFEVRANAVLNNGTFFEREINDVYLVKKDLDTLKMRLQEEEVAEVKYIPWKELKKEIQEENPEFVRHPMEYEKLFALLRDMRRKP